MKRAKGFTLVELVIVIVIVGILSIVAVPIYRGYTRKAMGTEAKSLLGSIQTAEKVYYAEMSEYLVYTGAFEPTLDVDSRANKYFTSYSISTEGTQGTDAYKFVATVSVPAGTQGNPAAGITMTLKAGVDGKPEWTDEGLN